MHVSRPASDGPETAEEFQANLVWLLRTAHDNGVKIQGGWMDRNSDDDRPDLGIEIYEVTKQRGWPFDRYSDG